MRKTPDGYLWVPHGWAHTCEHTCEYKCTHHKEDGKRTNKNLKDSMKAKMKSRGMRRQLTKWGIKKDLRRRKATSTTHDELFALYKEANGQKVLLTK